MDADLVVILLDPQITDLEVAFLESLDAVLVSEALLHVGDPQRLAGKFAVINMHVYHAAQTTGMRVKEDINAWIADNRSTAAGFHELAERMKPRTRGVGQAVSDFVTTPPLTCGETGFAWRSDEDKSARLGVAVLLLQKCRGNVETDDPPAHQGSDRKENASRDPRDCWRIDVRQILPRLLEVTGFAIAADGQASFGLA